MASIADLSDADLDRRIALASMSDEDLNASLTPEPADVDFDPGEMVSNIPSSAVGVATDIYNTVTSPIETGKNIGKAAIGGMQNLGLSILEPFLTEGEIPEGYRPQADAMVEAVKNRYGSMDKALETLEVDPVGVMVDMASLGTGASRRVGAAMNPVNVAKNTAKAATKAAVRPGLPEKIYDSAAKFGTTIPKAERAKMTQTALANRLAPSTKGVEKLQGLVDDLGTKINGLIDSAAQGGKKIPVAEINRHIAQLKKERGGVRLGAADDIAEIDRIIAGLEEHLNNLGKKTLTPKELQEFKIAAYKDINWDAKRGGGTPVKEDTYKAAARGAKETLEEVVPEVGGLNRAQGDLLNLQAGLQRAANRVENRNLIGLQAPVEVGAGAAIGGAIGGPLGAGIGMGLGLTAAILGHPKIAPYMAFGAKGLQNRKFAELFMKNNPNASIAELSAALAGRATEPDQSPEQ